MAPELYLPGVLVNNGIVARLAPRRAERYVVSSDWQRTELEELGFSSERISVIPNLVIEDKLKPSTKDAARAELGLPEGPLVGYIGHFHDVKGHDVLIEALRILRAASQSPLPKLVMAWSGIGSPQRVQAQL